MSENILSQIKDKEGLLNIINKMINQIVFINLTHDKNILESYIILVSNIFQTIVSLRSKDKEIPREELIEILKDSFKIALEVLYEIGIKPNTENKEE